MFETTSSVASSPSAFQIHPSERADSSMMRFRTVPSCLAILWLVAACGSDEAPSSRSVHPFDDVRASEMTFEADPLDPSRGIFKVTTSEPMICAIVWGTDSSFGRFNNSLAMDGTGIVQHDVSLPDVEQGVTYSYVVQGTTANGTLYRSDIGTFRIAGRAAARRCHCQRPRHKRRHVRVCDRGRARSFLWRSQRQSAIDGDLSTEWATRGDGDKGSVAIDLGVVVDIKGTEFVTRSMADGSSITSTYTVSIDGASPLGPFPAETLAVARPSSLTARGRVHEV